MDYFHSGGTTTRQHRQFLGGGGNNNGSSFRVSPVNLNVNQNQNPYHHRNNSSLSTSIRNSQQQRLHNNHYQDHVFGPVLQKQLFGRGGGGFAPPPGGRSSCIIPRSPPNYFNFPLRSNSNSMNGGNGSGGGGGVFFNNGNKSWGRNDNGNKVNVGQQDVVERLPTAQMSDVSPQYRIFKRGDTIEGINSPVVVTSASTPAGKIGHESMSVPIVGLPSGEDPVPGSFDFASMASAIPTDQSKENFKEGSDASSREFGSNKTSVSRVSDIARFHGLNVEYRLIGEKGPPHNPTFTVALHLSPTEQYMGQGSSIKRAQHAAAAEAVEKTELTRPAPRTRPNKRPPFGHSHGGGPPGGPGKRGQPNWALMQLTSLAEELKEPVSIAQQPVTLLVDPFRGGHIPAIVSVHVGERIFTGEGTTFNAAKNMAIMIALKAMIRVKQEIDLKNMAEAASTSSGGFGGEDSSDQNLNKSPISVLHEMAMKRALVVTFEVTKEVGPPHNKTFTVVCTSTTKSNLGSSTCVVDDTSGAASFIAEGEGLTKQAAKKVASEVMISKIKDVPIASFALQPTTAFQLNPFKSIQRGLFKQKLVRKKSSAPVVKDLDKQIVSPISRLIQIAHVRKYREPCFTLVASSVNALPEDLNVLKTMSERDRRNLRRKKPSFTMEVTCGPHICQGIGANKKAAKKAAAEATLAEMGYGVPERQDEGNGSTDELDHRGSNSTNDQSMGSSKSKGVGKPKGPVVVSARQIVPGVLVLNSGDTKDSGGGSPVRQNPSLAKEVMKMNNSFDMTSASSSSSCNDGIVAAASASPANNNSASQKLAYLARLLNIDVSYSDFPKKNEFLSVVSLGTKPPGLAHGCGATVEEAQNMAATKMLEELSDIGLDNLVVPQTAEASSSSA